MVLLHCVRPGNAWARSLCFGGGGRGQLFISCPALWAELAPHAGVHTSHPPAVSRRGPQLPAAGLERSPASFPVSSAEQPGRGASKTGPAGSARGLRGSRLACARLPKRLLLVSWWACRVTPRSPARFWRLNSFGTLSLFVCLFCLCVHTGRGRLLGPPFERANPNTLC